METPFWLHCNVCIRVRKNVPNKDYFVTECGHFYCDDCRVKLNANNNKCLRCKKQTSYRIINECLPDEVKFHFQSQSDTLKLVSSASESLSNEIKKVQSVNKFEKCQLQILLQGYERMQVHLKKRLEAAEMKNKQLQKEKAMLDARLRHEKSLRESAAGTYSPAGKMRAAGSAAPSISSQISTPNSRTFMGGALHNHNLPKVIPPTTFSTSTPFVGHPDSASRRYALGTPTPFITPPNTTVSDSSFKTPQQRIGIVGRTPPPPPPPLPESAHYWTPMGATVPTQHRTPSSAIPIARSLGATPYLSHSSLGQSQKATATGQLAHAQAHGRGYAGNENRPAQFPPNPAAQYQRAGSVGVVGGGGTLPPRSWSNPNMGLPQSSANRSERATIGQPQRASKMAPRIDRGYNVGIIGGGETPSSIVGSTRTVGSTSSNRMLNTLDISRISAKPSDYPRRRIGQYP